MYALKQAVHLLLMPLTVVLLLAAAAWALRLLRCKRASNAVLIALPLVAYLSSTSMVARVVLTPLEKKYPPLNEQPALPAVKFVVVLGSAYHPYDDVPVTAALDPDGLARIVEGVRLVRLLPHARLVVSGGAAQGKPRPAHGYAKLAQSLGVDRGSTVILDKARDTASEAREIASFLGAEPFILVTSSHHMPRAMLLMERAGLNAIAAPATQRVRPFIWRDFLPDSRGLSGTELAMHEYAGLAAIALGVE